MSKNNTKNLAHWRRNAEVPMEVPTRKNKPTCDSSDGDLLAKYEHVKKEYVALLEASEVWKESIGELGKLKKELAEKTAENEELKKSLKIDAKAVVDDNVRLRNALEIAQREKEDLERIQDAVEKNANYWRYIVPDKPVKRPKIGERVLGLVVDLRLYGEQLAERKNRSLGRAYYKEVVYKGGRDWTLPPNEIIVAWRPLYVMNEEKITATTVSSLIAVKNNDQLFNSVFSIPTRHLANPDLERERLKKLKKNINSAINKKISIVLRDNESLTRRIEESVSI